MLQSIMKRETSCILAFVLACLMVSAPFIGLLDMTCMPKSEEVEPMRIVEERAIASLEDIPLRQSTPLVYDSESDRIILFGGAVQNTEAEYYDTWSYDYNTNTWTNMSPAVHPPASNSHAMAYHSGADRVVLFGGHVSGSSSDWKNHNETWSYDYNTNTWTNMNPVVAPPAMCGGSMEYDSESDLMVLFGGWPDGGTTGTPIRQTWTYNLTSNTWTDVTPGVQPSARSWSQMAYDSESDLIVFFGGFALGADLWKVLNDTWTYDANTLTWTEISTVGPQVTGDIVYDSESDRVVFQGGCVLMSEYPEDLVSETWQYDTNTETWEEMVNEVKPPKRSRGEMAYDSESDKTILFSGIVWSGWPIEVLHDCWVYDLNNNLWNNVDWDWQEMTPAFSPGTRTGSPLVYDIESDRMVIFSGWQKVYADAVCYNDTWTYDYNSNTWTNMSPAVLPPGRTGHAMAYSQKDDTIVMFGGETVWGINEETLVADTWTYDLNTNTWTNMSPSTNPTPRTFSSMGYDNESDIFVLYGGILPDVSGSHETWLYNLTSNTWTNATTGSNPGDWWSASLPYDYKNNRLLLGGGGNWDGFNNEIWEYDFQANTWTLLIPSSAPPEVGLALSYDSESELLVAYGGPTTIYEEDYSLGTWTFNLTAGTWNSTYSLHVPSERSRQYLAYDIESDRTIMYGGVLPKVGQGEALGDTWVYNYIVNPPVLQPGKVKNLKVNPNSAGNALVLTWQAPDPILGVTVVGYNVYRGTESGVYELLAEIGDVLTYADKTAGYRITYYYTVTAVGTVEGEMCNEDFGSLPSSSYDDEVWTFIAYGDTRASSGGGVSPLHAGLVSKYLRSDPEMIIHTGDLMTQGGDAVNWPGYLQSVSAVGEWDPNLKIYYAVGNHEQYTSGPPDDDWSTYLSHVDFSDVVDETTGETELYYSFNWRNIHFIFLNTIDGWVDENFTCPPAQWNWLQSDFENNDKDLIVVSMHNPSHSVRADRRDRWLQAANISAAFHDLFVANGVDIVFSGHDHQYYHTVRDGIDYVVTGGGGAPLYEIDTEAPDWQPGDVGFSDYHYCVCSISRVNDTHSRLSVNTVKMDGTNADSFSLDFYDPLPPPPTTTTTTPTTPTTTTPFPTVMALTILGGAAAVIIVLAIVLRRKGR